MKIVAHISYISSVQENSLIMPISILE